jgi:hypothetical protein
VPVARTDPRRALAASVVVVVAAVLLVVLVLFLNSRGTGSGGGRFGELRVQDLLDRQAGDGVPTCFDDPVSGNRPICVFHTGDDPDAGWVAYDAQVDGCALEYRDSDHHTDSCTGATYPFTGEGLPQYGTSVDDGRLEIDLAGDDATTSTSSTSTSIDLSGDIPTTPAP